MEDTIAAVATAPGEGGIGIIRISGEKAQEILGGIFVRGGSVSEKDDRETPVFENRKMYYGHIAEGTASEVIDEAMAVYMPAPHTYTREDVAEIYCHGSMISLRKTLELILRRGARLAERGEFTKRAFLNGRIDLSKAEAVMDMISARTDRGFDIALSQMEGSLSGCIKTMRDDLLQVLAHVIVNIDYPDADIEEITYHQLERDLRAIRRDMTGLIDTAASGRIIRDGLNTVIIGKPNVGKSSLMNALLKESRAIVTEIPGTTRDTIEEIISIKNIPVRLIDTAGIRETDDLIEKIGIEKSKQSFNKADLVILILNASEALAPEDIHIIDHITAAKTIVLLNKVDIGRCIAAGDVESMVPGATVLQTAITEGQGIEELENEIEKIVYGGGVRPEQGMMITNVRHRDLLLQARSSIDDAIGMCLNNEALDFIEVDIRRTWELLGEIIGDTVSEDIVDEVFSRFCLGK